MIDLKPHADKFDGQFSQFDDSHYVPMVEAIKGFVGIDPGFLESECFKTIETYLVPIILIRNWKSQTPFPLDIATVIRKLSELAGVSDPDPQHEEYRRIFQELISLDGFQLPTVSAFFHFMHPNRFPIVDRNVEAACQGLEEPSVPPVRLPLYNESPARKYDAYLEFIGTIKAIIREQRTIQRGNAKPWPTGDGDFRSADKALMVLGAEMLKDRKRRALA